MALDANIVKETEADDRAAGGEEDNTDKGLDTNLGSLFNGAGDEDDEEPALEATEKVEAVKVPVAAEENDDRYNTLQEQVSSLRDNQIRLQTENEILRGRRDGSLREEEEDSNEIEVDFAELNAEISADPAKAITKLINTITPQIEKRVLKQAAAHTSTTVGRSAALQNDVAVARAQFGNLPFDNPEFGRMAESIYEELTDGAPVINANGTKYRSGAVMQSMEIAYARMVRAGKIKPGESNGNGKGLTITERKKTPLSPRMGSGSDADSERPGEAALAGYSAREIATMRKTAKDMGVPFEKVVKKMAKLRADDPNYGGLRNG